MTRHLMLLMGLLAGVVNSAWGAGFDCQKAASPTEKAICANADLSLADEVMTESYRFLTASCQALARREDLKASQQRWLADTHASFTADAAGLAASQTRYSARNRVLTRLLSQCSLERPGTKPVAVIPLTSAKLGYTLPYVVAASPEIGRRINDAVFQRLLDMPAPGKVQDGLTAAEQRDPADAPGPMTGVSHTVLLNNGRLLALEIKGEGCNASCQSFTDPWLFDARTGHAVSPEDLLTDAGTQALAQRLKDRHIRRGKSLVSLARREKRLSPDDKDTYLQCLHAWSEEEPRLWPLMVDAQGQWRWVASHCSGPMNWTRDLLDGLDEPTTLAQLAPYLNAYGHSLLRGQGDVRDPMHAMPPCAPGEQPPRAKAAIDTDGIASVSAGEEHHLLLQTNGRLWAWGRNSDGQLGHDDHRTGSGAFLPPVVVGDDFIQADAGQFSSAGIRRDGTLWTWGSNYAGRLGDGGMASQTRPVKIGSDFVQVIMESSQSLALQRNGQLWIWGGEQTGQKDKHGNDLYRLTPRPLATDVAQMVFGPQALPLALKKDGSLWHLSLRVSKAGLPDGDGAQKVGEGYTRLAAHQASAAFKADGSLWAWGDTLAGLMDTSDRSTQDPTEVVPGLVDVKVAGPDFVVALGADGRLWATRQRGQHVTLAHVACGIKDAVALGSARSSPPHGVTVLALKHDGSLLAWANWRGQSSWQASKHLFIEPPITLGTGFRRLYQVGGHFGSLGASAVALKSDDSVWQTPRIDINAPAALPKGLLQKVDFPTNWKQR